jgi:hypothetical protein
VLFCLLIVTPERQCEYFCSNDTLHLNVLAMPFLLLSFLQANVSLSLSFIQTQLADSNTAENFGAAFDSVKMGTHTPMVAAIPLLACDGGVTAMPFENADEMRDAIVFTRRGTCPFTTMALAAQAAGAALLVVIDTPPIDDIPTVMGCTETVVCRRVTIAAVLMDNNAGERLLVPLLAHQAAASETAMASATATATAAAMATATAAVSDDVDDDGVGSGDGGAGDAPSVSVSVSRGAVTGTAPYVWHEDSHNERSLSPMSSRGPTLDGRIKVRMQCNVM